MKRKVLIVSFVVFSVVCNLLFITLLQAQESSISVNSNFHNRIVIIDDNQYRAYIGVLIFTIVLQLLIVICLIERNRISSIERKYKRIKKITNDYLIEIKEIPSLDRYISIEVTNYKDLIKIINNYKGIIMCKKDDQAYTLVVINNYKNAYVYRICEDIKSSNSY